MLLRGTDTKSVESIPWITFVPEYDESLNRSASTNIRDWEAHVSRKTLMGVELLKSLESDAKPPSMNGWKLSITEPDDGFVVTLDSETASSDTE